MNAALQLSLKVLLLDSDPFELNGLLNEAWVAPYAKTALAPTGDVNIKITHTIPRPLEQQPVALIMNL